MKRILLLALAAALAAPARAATPSTTSSSGPYLCDGATTVAFTAGFSFLENGHLVVKKKQTSTAVETTLSLGTDYTVTGAGGTSGTVTLTAASKCPTGHTLSIRRVVPFTNPLALSPGQAYSGPAHAKAFDRLTHLTQQLERDKAARPPSCPAGQVLTGDGTNLSCVADVTAGGAASDTSTVVALGSSAARPLRDRFADVVNLRDHLPAGQPDGATDNSAAFAAAYAALPPTGGTIAVPPGTYRVNLTISKSNVALRGQGRRATWLKPFANAPVITITSAGGAVQSTTIEELGFSGAGTGTTSAAILVTGANINDWHWFRRLFVSGFTDGISVTGRTIWTRFDDVEVTGDAARGIYVDTAEAFNAITFQNVRAGECAQEGIYLKKTGADPMIAISFLGVNAENNGTDGVRIENVEELHVSGSYFENNGQTDAVNAAAFRITGTYAMGLSITSSIFWGSAWALKSDATLITGTIKGNRMATNGAVQPSLYVHTSHANSSVVVAGNYGAVHDLTGNVWGIEAVRPTLLRYKTALAQALTSGAANALNFDSADYDTAGAVTNPSTDWKFTVPAGRGGYYTISAGAGVTAAGASTYLSIFKNNAEIVRGQRVNAAGVANVNLSVNSTLLLAAGDYIRIHLFTNQAATTLQTGAESNYVTITRLPVGF